MNLVTGEVSTARAHGLHHISRMAEPLKTFFSPALVRRLAGDIERVHPAFSSPAFVRDATNGLETLELLDRGKHIARALEKHLPASYPDAIDILLMRAQYELTKRFSAESSIRPFIAAEPERTLATLREWASDPNAHVRRLVSEGTRLRLPWAMRVPWLDANPERVIELLELLRDDPASLVRRSVANSLNDLGKVYPALLTRTCAAWLEGASAERRALVEHALRSAVKRGDASALRLVGYGKKAAVTIDGVRIR
ncbi:MAG: putative alkylation repair enzyme, partial [Geminicoccaceae bacterium]|nr:putative alkylation repair enzyme [Geminicoccaceae bacterium]